MNLKNLLKLFSDKNCETVYIKRLVKNNNSKQQIYVAQGDTQILNVFPVNDFKAVLNENAKKETFHASCMKKRKNFFKVAAKNKDFTPTSVV